MTCLEEAHRLRPADMDILRLLTDVYHARGRFPEARDGYEKILAADTVTARDCNNYAWLLLMGPPDMRDPLRALELAERATAEAPKETTYLNTLGVARYRNGGYQAALPGVTRAF